MLGNRLVSGRRLSGAVCWPVCVLVLFCSLPPSARSQKTTPARPAPQFAQAPVQVDSTDQTNQRIAELAKVAAPKRLDYRVGVDDVLTIEVFEVPELSRDVRVNGSGSISLPLLPAAVPAAGLSLDQLQVELAEDLRSNGLITNPQVTVRVKELHSAPITVMGAVKSPGVVQADRQMSLLEVLTQVGGLAPDAGNQIIVTRPTVGGNDPAVSNTDSNGGPQAPMSASPGVAEAQTFTIDLTGLLDSGGTKGNILVYPNDVIRVPRGGVVYALGSVSRPGGYVMQSDATQLTVLKILSLAGGLGPTAKSDRSFILRTNASTGKQDHLPLDIRKILRLKSDDVSLEQSDILYVPDSAALRALRRTGEFAISLGTGVALYRAVTP